MIMLESFLFQTLSKSVRIMGMLVLSMLITHTSQASAFKPPSEVVQSFNEHYPDAKSTKWTKIKDEDKPYKVSFVQKKVKLNAYFNKEGKWIETEKNIRLKALPETIKATLDSQFGEIGYSMLHATEILQNDGAIVYAVSIRSSGRRSNLLVTMEGSFSYR
ncbi:MAG: PepSY-like domain-containing protein [Bacteroidia bacterium]